MSTIVRFVRDFDLPMRQALERELGSPLQDSQTVVINVVDAKPEPVETSRASATLPDWCNVYEGLSDEEIERLDQATKRRLDLSRGSN